MTDSMPFSQACENNKKPILDILRSAFADCSQVLEIGSGTGQHAVFFAEKLPHLIWQTSDQVEYHQGVLEWIKAFPSKNLRAPLTLKVGKNALPLENYDGVFTANTTHIMQPEDAKLMMESMSLQLPERAVVCQYGPFTLNGDFSSDSNAEFHQRLISQGYGGYQDINDLKAWAPNLKLVATHTMPANNLLLQWQKHRLAQ